MDIGYARVSTGEQNLDLQKDALEEAGCEEIYTDQVSGAKSERPGLEEAISHLRKGDCLVVWKLGSARPLPQGPDRVGPCP
jgi:DNA invertase Pin-like site-specific DNA recombinase